MNKAKDKKLLKKYLTSLVSCVCGFFEHEFSIILINNSTSVADFLDKVVFELRQKENNGWNGDDLKEEQLNILTLISEVYLKRNKSKYKKIQTPSEIIDWFSIWLQDIFTQNELKWENYISNMENHTILSADM